METDWRRVTIGSLLLLLVIFLSVFALYVSEELEVGLFVLFLGTTIHSFIYAKSVYVLIEKYPFWTIVFGANTIAGLTYFLTIYRMNYLHMWIMILALSVFIVLISLACSVLFWSIIDWVRLYFRKDEEDNNEKE